MCREQIPMRISSQTVQSWDKENFSARCSYLQTKYTGWAGQTPCSDRNQGYIGKPSNTKSLMTRGEKKKTTKTRKKKTPKPHTALRHCTISALPPPLPLVLPPNWCCHQSWHILPIPSPNHSSFLSSLRNNCMEKTQWRGQQSASRLYHKLWNTEESFGLMHTHTHKKRCTHKKTRKMKQKYSIPGKKKLTAHTTYLWRHIATLRHPFPPEIQVLSYLRISCSTRHLRGKTQLMLQDTHLK